MARSILFCTVIGVLLALASSSTNLRSEKQQRSLSSTTMKAHQMGEIDWEHRGVDPSPVSPPVIPSVPAFKPSSKPIESDVIVSLNPRTVGLGGLKGEDHNADEQEILHVLPSHNTNEKKTPMVEDVTATTVTVTDNIAPEIVTDVPVAATEGETVEPSTSNLLPLDPTVVQEEGQTIEDVVAHTTITVAPTNTDSSGNSAEISTVIDTSNVATSPRPMNSVNSKTSKAPIVTTTSDISIPTIIAPSVVSNSVSSKSSKTVISPISTSTMTSSSKAAKKEEKQEAKKEEKQEAKEEVKAEKQAAKEQEREEDVAKGAKESKRTQHEKGEEAKDEKPVMFIPLSERPYTNMKNLSG